jgi:hypothetical protein
MVAGQEDLDVWGETPTHEETLALVGRAAQERGEYLVNREIALIESSQPSTDPPFKLTPPKVRHVRVSRAAKGKAQIPPWAFSEMYRICYGATNSKEVSLLRAEVKGRVAKTLGLMVDSGADLSRLKHFEVWWANTFYSKGQNNTFIAPTPERVRDLWWVAMKDVSAALETAVKHSEVVDEAALQEVMMQRAAANRRAK